MRHPAECGACRGAIHIADPREQQRPGQRRGYVVAQEARGRDSYRTAQDRQGPADPVREPHQEHDSRVVAVHECSSARDRGLHAGRQEGEERVAEAAAEGEVDLVSERRGDAGQEPHGPRRPIPLRRERPPDDDGGFALQPGPDEQHRAAVAVDDRAEVHCSAITYWPSRPSPWKIRTRTRTRRETDGWAFPRELRTTEGNVRHYATHSPRWSVILEERPIHPFLAEYECAYESSRARDAKANR